MTILTIGTFDPFHAGHADLLNWCKKLGDYVIVGVLSDAFVGLAKGKFPQHSEEDRVAYMQPLCDLAYVEHGRVLEREYLPDELIHPDAVLALEPGDMVVVGGDWHVKDYHSRLGLSQHQLDILGVAVTYVPRYIQISSTEIKERARGTK